MKLRTAHHPCKGISLIECLVYIALFLVVTTLTSLAYYRVDVESRALARNTEDVLQAMKAGERWRADIRQSTSAPRMVNGALVLTTRQGEVVYTLENAAIWRRAGNAKPLPVLERVKDSKMEPEARAQVTAWKWELALQSKRSQTSVNPLFTFMAVPPQGVAR